MSAEARGALDALAAAEGVLRSYTETTGRRRRASPAALAAVLRALGHDVDESGRGAGEALREADAARAARLAEPVAVAWGRGEARIPVTGRERPAWTLALEEGGEVHGRANDGTVELPRLPYGRHVLHLEAGGRKQDVTVLQAPRRAHAGAERSWGLFVPLYALPGPFGPGDFTRMRELAEWTAGLGGDLVGSTPVNAAFLGEPFEPSPYLPVSRLHWNELYADPAATPEWAASARARELVAAVPPPEGRLIDYRAAAAAKRRVLEALLADLDGARLAAFEEHLRAHPDVAAYADFRARCERERAGWRDWSHPDTQAVGGVSMCHSQAGEAAAARYHAYAQWLCEDQLARVAEGGAGPYLDMPLGVHPGGYDTWRFRELFAEGVSVGAPPDDFFRGGQDWGLAPLHPGRLREGGHAYPLACAAALCRHAAAARIDHVMGLHRMFWVPHGLPATEGVYVRYPSEELYAVLCIESHRHRTRLVGEDMGTVPGGVRRTMAAHGLLRTYAVQAELGHGADPFDRVPSAAMVGMNTHDMPTFAGFWDTDGAADGRRDALRARLERRGHAVTDGPAALDACLLELAGTDAQALLVSLEDMWWEHERQNVPGTTTEHPNWQRLARYGVDELDAVPDLAPRLRRIADARRSPR
ncbi:MAG TPA: 4-alpha-glucanotransferase [Gaiellales bacterium]|jgi:4-alpha-glucanotransferase|nr:4-alpha-glucanotransferase [Gaiellales bacterium]